MEISLPDHIRNVRISVDDDQTPVVKAADSDGVVASCTVLKASDEDRVLLTVAYPANKADTVQALDGYRDFASARVVEKAAWSFMRKGAKLGMWHQDGNDHCATTVESYIYRGPDWVTKAADGSEQTITAGDWLLAVECTPATWDLYKSGKLGGVSPQGTAKRRTPSDEALANLRS